MTSVPAVPLPKSWECRSYYVVVVVGALVVGWEGAWGFRGPVLSALSHTLSLHLSLPPSLSLPLCLYAVISLILPRTVRIVSGEAGRAEMHSPVSSIQAGCMSVYEALTYIVRASGGEWAPPGPTYHV